MNTIRLIVNTSTGDIIRWVLIQEENVSRIPVSAASCLVAFDRIPGVGEERVDLGELARGHVQFIEKG